MQGQFLPMVMGFLQSWYLSFSLLHPFYVLQMWRQAPEHGLCPLTPRPGTGSSVPPPAGLTLACSTASPQLTGQGGLSACRFTCTNISEKKRTTSGCVYFKSLGLLAPAPGDTQVSRLGLLGAALVCVRAPRDCAMT